MTNRLNQWEMINLIRWCTLHYLRFSLEASPKRCGHLLVQFGGHLTYSKLLKMYPVPMMLDGLSKLMSLLRSCQRSFNWQGQRGCESRFEEKEKAAVFGQVGLNKQGPTWSCSHQQLSITIFLVDMGRIYQLFQPMSRFRWKSVKALTACPLTCNYPIINLMRINLSPTILYPDVLLVSGAIPYCWNALPWWVGSFC